MPAVSNEIAITTPGRGKAPAIVLCNPKYTHNVGTIVRTASCFGIGQLWWSGDRLDFTSERRPTKQRLPREERLRDYTDVARYNVDDPLRYFEDASPVAVEVTRSAIPLHVFQHPVNAVYVFGPEDGSIDADTKARCHYQVILPVRHCLNLAVTVGLVMWDRQMKLYEQGQRVFTTPGEFEQRGLR